MKRQLGPMLTALALLCAPAAWAQSYTDSALSTSGSSSQVGSSDSLQFGTVDPVQNGTTDPSQNGTGDTQQAGASGPQSTFLHPEELPGINMIGDLTANTGLRLNFSTGEVVQSASGYGSGHSYLQSLSLFSGGLHILQVRPTLTWALGYNGGLSLSAGVGNAYTTLNQSANARVTWMLGKRWQMRVKDNFLYSDDPFQPYLTNLADPRPNDPNPVIYYPRSVVEQNQGSVDLTYMITPHDTIDVSGSESFQRYLRGSAGLSNSFTYGGGAFYQHTFSSQLSAGGGYQFTALDFGHGQSRAGVQMFEGFVSYKFSPSLSISGWVGPELTNNKDLIPIYCSPRGCFVEEQHRRSLDVAEGGNLTWVTSHNGVRGTFSHRVTNGGGILGAISLYQVSMGYQRTLSRVWSLNAGLMYNNSKSVSHFRASQYLKGEEGTLGFNRRFGDAWNANFYYAFIHQSQNYYSLPSTITTNGIGLTVRYVWGHSLGR